MGLSNKTAIVFGHTSGLGYSITKLLLDRGCRVIGISRTVSSFNSDDLVNIQADLSKSSEIKKVIKIISSEYSSFDFVIYCSGILTSHKMENLNYKDTEQLYKVNVLAPMQIESDLLKQITINDADVVNITSSVLEEYYPNYSEYTSGKAALRQFTIDLHKELEYTKCRVIDFCPGAFTSKIYKEMTGEKIDRDESKQVSADEYAKILIYLLELPKIMEVPKIYVNRKRL